MQAHSSPMGQDHLTGDNRDKVLSSLKNLAEINEDGHQGYLTAAENVKNPEYASLFRTFSQQRRGFEQEIRNHITRLGGDSESTSVGGALTDAAGALHRGWINLKSAVTGGGVEALLNECERGDEAAVKAYQEALELPLPSEVASVIRQQYTSVQEAYTRVKGLARVEA